MNLDTLSGVNQPRIRLIEHLDVLGKPELGEVAHGLLRRPRFKGGAGDSHGQGKALQFVGLTGLGRAQIQTARLVDELNARCFFQFGKTGVGMGCQADYEATRPKSKITTFIPVVMH